MHEGVEAVATAVSDRCDGPQSPPPFMWPAEVAATAMKIDMIQLAAMVEAHELLGFPDAAGAWQFPAVQFEELVGPRFGVYGPLAGQGGLLDRWQAFPGEAISRLLVLPSDELIGRSPIEWIKGGYALDVMFRYADRLERERYSLALDPSRRLSRRIPLQEPVEAQQARARVAGCAASLSEDSRGRWLIHTESSWHLVDLDGSLYARIPGREFGEHVDAACFRQELVGFGRIRVGSSAVLWVGDQPDPELAHWILLPEVLDILSVHPRHVLGSAVAMRR